MKIDRNQMLRFADAERAAFVHAAAEWFAAVFPEFAFPRRLDRYKVFVAEALDEALAAGFERREWIMRYIEFRFLVGGPIAADPAWHWLTDSLAHDGRAEADRIAAADALLNGAPL